MSDGIMKYLDPKILFYGLAATLLIYLALFSYVLFTSSSYLQKLEETLPRTTILIEEQQDVVQEQDEEPEAKTQTPQQTQTDPAEPDQQTPAEAPKKQASISFDPALYEKVPSGYIPRISTVDQNTVFDAYHHPFEAPLDKKIVAIALRDIGLSKDISMQAIEELPSEITMILNPYGSNMKELGNALRRSDHEFWLSIPMEDMHYPLDDPGPKAILSRSSYEYNLENLRWALSRTYGYVGVTGEADRSFMKVKSMLASLLEFMFERGLAYYELNPEAPYSHDVYAAQLNARYGQNEAGTWHSFDEAISITEESLFAGQMETIIVPTTPANIAAIKRWLQTKDDKNIVLAPLSATY